MNILKNIVAKRIVNKSIVNFIIPPMFEKIVIVVKKVTSTFLDIG